MAEIENGISADLIRKRERKGLPTCSPHCASRAREEKRTGKAHVVSTEGHWPTQQELQVERKELELGMKRDSRRNRGNLCRSRP